MANDLNQCTFVGRLGRDPETRTFASGDQVCNIRIAVGASWKDKATGEKMERTEWVPVVFNGKLAEIAAQYLRKGAQVLVVGEFRTRKYQDKDGADRYATEIRADQMQMLGGKNGAGSDSDDGAGYQAAPRRAATTENRATSAPPPMSRAPSGFDDMDDDIPFADPLSFRGAHLVL